MLCWKDQQRRLNSGLVIWRSLEDVLRNRQIPLGLSSLLLSESSSLRKPKIGPVRTASHPEILPAPLWTHLVVERLLVEEGPMPGSRCEDASRIDEFDLSLGDKT